MLSKSAARAFFLAGTALCASAFIGLTVDSFRRIPAQTHAEAITPAVARGKDLWDANNCMGCHTLLGEGGYYAPELTKVYSRRGEQFIRQMLDNPEAMYPGQRRMQRYGFNEAQISDLVAFFQWIDRMDLNGFPAKPTITMAGSAPTASDPHQPQTFRQVCTACHAVQGRGGAVGPSLDGIADRRDATFLRRWLKDPPAVKPGTTMPNLHLSDTQLDELTSYLSTLSASGARR